MRGAAGDLKVAGAMRVLSGEEEQAADPLIASVEGIGKTPAFRGLLVVVFEELALAEYGNRIPMLTFEVVADSGSVGGDFVLGDASEGLIDCVTEATLIGYSAHGSDLGDAPTPLIDVLGLSLRDDGVRLTDRGPASFSLRQDDLGCAADHGSVAEIERTRAPLASLPSGLGLSYFDPARDYQAGLASVGETGGRALKQIGFAAALPAEQARSLADGYLSRAWAGRDRVTLHLPSSVITVQPGDLVNGGNLVGTWQVGSVDMAGMVTTIELRRATEPRVEAVADGGRSIGSIDAVAQPTELALLDLPGGDGAALTLAGATAGPWRPVSVSLSANGMALPAMTILRPAMIGKAVQALGIGPAELLDEVNVVDVDLVDANGWLTACDDDALAMGANAAAIGDEIIQFGRADPIAPGRFRLSRLLRGRRGSEWAIGVHQEAEQFVLLDAARLLTVPVPLATVGAIVSAQPHGLADGASGAVTRTASGDGVRPLSPCHLKLVASPDGLRISWVRRSRGGFAWLDGSDAPLGETVERYRVRISGLDAAQEWQTEEPVLQLQDSDLTGLGPGKAIVAVAQLGDGGPSRELVGSMAWGDQ